MVLIFSSGVIFLAYLYLLIFAMSICVDFFLFSFLKQLKSLAEAHGQAKTANIGPKKLLWRHGHVQ